MSKSKKKTKTTKKIDTKKKIGATRAKLRAPIPRAKKSVAAPPPESVAGKLQVFSGKVGDHARQGDVLLRRVAAIPDGAEKVTGGVIRQGTATGHAHQFKDGAQLYRAKDGVLFVHVTGAQADLVHEEHGTIRITGPAFLQHIQQREFDGEAERAVMD